MAPWSGAPQGSPARLRGGPRVLLPLLWLLIACSAPGRAWPVTVGCDPEVPGRACGQLLGLAGLDPGHFTPAPDPALADLRLTRSVAPYSRSAGNWTYAVAAPFRTVDDDVASADLVATWLGTPSGPFVAHPLLVSPDTLRALATLWGPPAATVRPVDSSALLATASQQGAWAILPFDELRMGWKVLRVDGVSLLEKGLEGDGAPIYPLQVPLALGTGRRPDALALLLPRPGMLRNRREQEMTIVAMTGVTALVRTTAHVMDDRGITYPARDIQGWLSGADLTHISNEVCFAADCPVTYDLSNLRFCSPERYLGLLEAVGTDIVELTGNHLIDYGPDPLRLTLELYRQRGWHWYAGGLDLAEATRPLTITQGPNRLAFIGCNSVGPGYNWATADSPGSAPCDYELMQANIRALHLAGYLPIVTLQYQETYQYMPTPQQVADFRALAAAGAVVVQGSQAHQPQAIEFYGDTFIHYGLGNLFFDQMQSPGTRQEFIDRLVFYDGQLLSIELRTAFLEDYARPRPMTGSERAAFLRMMLALQP